MRTTIALHGNAVSYAESPHQFEQVDGIPWTDIVGLRMGLGSRFRGRSNTLSWFHYALASVPLVRDGSYGLSRLRVLVDIQGGARLDHVHIWDAYRHRLHAVDGLRASSDVDIPLADPLAATGDLSVSLGVRFSEPANVIFRGIIAELTPVTAPQICSEVTSTFIGTATLHSANTNVGSRTAEVRFRARFGSDCRTMLIERLEPIQPPPFPTPLGLNTSTITLIGAGVGEIDRSGAYPRRLSVPIILGLDNTLEGANPDSTLSLTLTTESQASFRGELAGRRMDTAGRTRLVGAGRFRGGYLHDSEAALEVEGQFDAVP